MAVVIVAVVVVVAVVSVAAAALAGSFWGQNFEMCPSCLQLQQRGLRPSTTTIICLSLLMMTSGIAWKPSLSRQIRNTWSPQAVPAADLRRLLSSTRPNLLRKAASTSPVINAGTLHTVTRTLRVPMYSGCNRKNLVVMVVDAAFAACSLDGSRTSQVAKLLRQKYWQGTPAFRRRSSNPSFFSPTSRLVFRSVITSDNILGSSFSIISGMGKISLPLKYWAYLPTRFFSWSSGFLSSIFHGVFSGLFSFCAGWIGLSDSEGVGSDGQFAPMRLVASGCLGGASFSFFSGSCRVRVFPSMIGKAIRRVGEKRKVTVQL